MKHSGIPVLMYHSLADSGNKQDVRHVSISLSAFKAQMDWLYREGYRTVSGATFMQYMDGCWQPDGKWVKLTFDDGYHSWYEHAREILAQYSFSATMFLSTAYVSGVYSTPEFSFAANDRPLTWSEINELAGCGWSVQAHGHTHPKWTYMRLEAVKQELDVCRREIEQKVGLKVDKVAFPYGEYTRDILNHLAEEGYQAGYSVHTGKAFAKSDKLRIPRIEINNQDTLASFSRKVETGYASTAQAIKAKVRNILYANPVVKDIIKAAG